MEQIEKIFKIRENHTTVKTEIIAGLTTFMTEFMEWCIFSDLYRILYRYDGNGVCCK